MIFINVSNNFHTVQTFLKFQIFKSVYKSSIILIKVSNLQKKVSYLHYGFKPSNFSTLHKDLIRGPLYFETFVTTGNLYEDLKPLWLFETLWKFETFMKPSNLYNLFILTSVWRILPPIKQPSFTSWLDELRLHVHDNE